MDGAGAQRWGPKDVGQRMDVMAMAGTGNGRGRSGGAGMGERKVGEVQLEVSDVNEIFSSGGPRRIAEIAEAEMINI